MKYLGFWVTYNGVKPVNKKIESIKNMTPQNSRKGFQKIIGLVNYYCNIWEGHPHTLETLTNSKPSKVRFKWTEAKQKTFEELSALWPIIIC